MEFVMESFHADWEAFLRFAPRLLYGIAILVFFLVVGRVVSRVLGKALTRTSRFRTNLPFLKRLVTLGVSAVGLLLSLGVMGFEGVAASLLATGGVVAIVLGFAFREIGENFLAGFFLSFSRPFELGDMIMTGELTGIVRTIELRYVHIRTFDACDVYVPSAQIFREALYNYTRDGLRRPSFTVGVAFQDDPREVVKVLSRAAAGPADVLAEPAPFVTIKEFADNFVVYEVFFWLDVTEAKRGFIEVRNDVKAACWQALGDAGFTFSTDVTSGIDVKSAPELRITSAPDAPVPAAG